jgi:hypothetical protein
MLWRRLERVQAVSACIHLFQNTLDKRTAAEDPLVR